MIHIICALKCEAKPLRHHFQLKHVKKAKLFNTYLNEALGLSLTISGIGKQASTAATMHARMLLDAKSSDAWINIGVAGHKTLAIGQLVLANRIEDAGNGQTWYPQIIFKSKLPSTGLLTLDKPLNSYDEIMYDMEGSGFFATASRFATAELIHCLKIVSDNQANPAQQLAEKIVSELIAEKTAEINDLFEQLWSLSSRLESVTSVPQHYEQCLLRWHFTQYQKGVLQRLLRRWQTLRQDSSLFETTLTNIRRANDVLTYLEDELDKILLPDKAD